MFSSPPNNPQNQTSISLSTWSVIKVFLILLGFWFLYLIRDVILILFVAMLLASILDAPARWLQTKKIPRAVSVILIYFLFLAVIAFLAGSLIPPLTSQIRQLAAAFPSYLDRLSNFFQTSSEIFSRLQDSIKTLAGSIASGTTTNIFSTVTSFFGGFISTLIVFVVTFYMVVEEDAIKRIVRSTIPDKYQPYLTQLFGRMQTKLGLWLRGQLTLSVIVGILVYIGLTILQVPYALVLALLAGLLEFIPYVGPISAAIPSIVIALSLSPLRALAVLALYVLVQQVENHILVPKIMQKAVGLNPIVSIVALLIGVKIGGVLGALLSIPLATALSVLIKDFYQEVKTS